MSSKKRVAVYVGKHYYEIIEVSYIIGSIDLQIHKDGRHWDTAGRMDVAVKRILKDDPTAKPA